VIDIKKKNNLKTTETEKSENVVCGEIAIIQMKHTERIAFLGLILGTVLAFLFAITALYSSLYPLSTWIMLDAIVFLVTLVFVLIYYFMTVNPMKDKVKRKMKAQVELLYIVIAIVVILIIISYLRSIGAI